MDVIGSIGSQKEFWQKQRVVAASVLRLTRAMCRHHRFPSWERQDDAVRCLNF